MCKVKKIILSLTIALTMLGALIFGAITYDKPLKNSVLARGGGTINNEVEIPQKPAYPVKQNLTFKPGEVRIQRGSGDISFEYDPDNVQGAASVAYQYCFNNPMTDLMAINLKSIDTTGVTVTYAYHDSEQTSISSSSTIFEAQTIESYRSKYMYIVVSASGNIPTSFQSKVVWYQGRAGEIEIYNTDGTLRDTQALVKGQPILEPVIDAPVNAEIVWYLDADCKIKATFPLDRIRPLYVKVSVPNLPSDWLTLSGNSYTIEGGAGATLPLNLVIPSTYNGKPVTSVSYEAFKDNTTIKTVVIPDSVRTINGWSFAGCTNLESVEIPNGVEFVGGASFNGCTSLKEIALPDGVSLGRAVFSGCTNLTKVVLPSTITNMPENSFYKCRSLVEIEIPNKVTNIGEYAFAECSTLKSIIIPDSVTTMGINVFALCPALISANLPKGMTEVPDGMFYECSSLQTVGDLGKLTNLEKIGKHAFDHCSNLISIGNIANCIKLTTIENGAFLCCTSLQRIALPNSITTISKQAFDSCTSLTTIGDWSTFNNLTTIGERAFIDCSGLTGDIAIPSSIIQIGQRAFRRIGYTSITFADSSGWYVTTNTDYTGGTELTSSDVSANSTAYLKTTYYTYYWYKA